MRFDLQRCSEARLCAAALCTHARDLYALAREVVATSRNTRHAITLRRHLARRRHEARP